MPIPIRTLSAANLAETLASTPPLSLKGPALLTRLRAEAPAGQGRWLPVSPADSEEIAAATAEVLHLVSNSQQLAEMLSKLTPIPLTTASLVEFPL